MTLTDVIAKVTRYAKRVIVTDNSSSDAVRITQTGSGNALVVEDSTSPDATPFVISATGRVIAGSQTILDTFRQGKFNAYHGGGEVAFDGIRYSDDALGSNLALGKSRGTTIGSKVAVQANDVIGNIEFTATNGTSYFKAASVTGKVTGTPSDTSMPGSLAFNTTPSGSTSPTERMFINSSGQVKINRQNTTGAGGHLALAQSSDNTTGWYIDISGTTTPRFRAVDVTSGVAIERFSIKPSGAMALPTLPTYANNADAITGGLVVHDVYKTSAGELRIVV
jgi:hypothetical protein